MSSDAKVMVRRGELACRNGWDEDLFEPKVADRGGTGVVPLTLRPIRPEPPATPKEIDAVMNAQSQRPESEPEGTDVVLDHVVVGETPARSEVDDRPTLLNNDPRAAILKAREKFKASGGSRRRAMEVAASDTTVDPADDDAPAPSARAADRFQAPVTGGQGESMSTPAQGSSLGGSAETPRAKAEDPFDSVPPVVPGFDLPKRPPAKTRGLPLLDEGEEDESDLLDGPAARPRGGRELPRFSERISLWARGRRPLGHGAGLVAGGGPLERFVDRDYTSVADDASSPTRFVPPPPVPVHEMTPTPATSASAVVAPAPEPAPFVPEPEPVGSFDVVVEDDEPIAVGPEIAPTVPRMCRTCRDFRPADSGERGWCTNRWAFTHRRMVHDDELPCETSLGCWWLPHDEIWLAAADISGHGEGTPLVDRWLGDRTSVARRQPS